MCFSRGHLITFYYHNSIITINDWTNLLAFLSNTHADSFSPTIWVSYYTVALWLLQVAVPLRVLWGYSTATAWAVHVASSLSAFCHSGALHTGAETKLPSGFPIRIQCGLAWPPHGTQTARIALLDWISHTVSEHCHAVQHAARTVIKAVWW